jgi:ribosomal protein S17E
MGYFSPKLSKQLDELNLNYKNEFIDDIEHKRKAVHTLILSNLISSKQAQKIYDKLANQIAKHIIETLSGEQNE